MHVLFKQLPTIDHPATNHDDLRIQNIDQVRDPNPKIDAHAPENLEREFVALLSRIEDHLRRSILASLQHRIRIARARLTRHAHNRRRRSKDFKTTTTPARTRNTTKRIDTHVSNLSRRAIHTTPQLAVENDSTTDTSPERQANDRLTTNGGS